MGRKRQGKVERHLPLKPAVFHMLVALSEAESYGYGVIRSVRQRSGGRIDLQTGTFYRHLRRLLDDGLVEERGAGPAGDDPRRGSYYGLTSAGREVVRAEWQRMSELVGSTRDVVLADEDGS
jgi:DNA-binding PadR family transcriptional regulator